MTESNCLSEDQRSARDVAMVQAMLLTLTYDNYTAAEFACASDGDMELRTQELRKLKRIADDLEADRVAQVTPHNNVVKQLNSDFKHLATKLTAVMDALKTGIGNYQRAQAEAKAKADRLAREAAEAATRKLLKQANAALASGKEERAEALLTRASAVTAELAPPPPKAAGVSTRTLWHYEVTNSSLVPREYLMVDETKLNAVVRAMKELTNIPGVRAFPKTSMSVRGE